MDTSHINGLSVSFYTCAFGRVHHLGDSIVMAAGSPCRVANHIRCGSAVHIAIFVLPDCRHAPTANKRKASEMEPAGLNHQYFLFDADGRFATNRDRQIRESAPDE